MISIKRIIGLLFMFVSFIVMAQDYRVEEKAVLNTNKDEFPNQTIAGDLYYFQLGTFDPLHEEDIDLSSIPTLKSMGIDGVDKGDQYEERIRKSFPGMSDIHAVIFTADSVGFALEFGSLGGTQLWYLHREGQIKVFGLEEKIYHLSEGDGSENFICSYLNSTSATLDLAVLQIEKEKAQLIPITNFELPGNQLFPTWHDGDLYFSSDHEGRLDIYIARKEKQWKDPEQLPEPLNSPYDDHSIKFSSEEKGYFASSRPAEMKGDNIWTFDRTVIKKMEQITARLMVGETGLKDIPIQVLDANGALLFETRTDENGVFQIAELIEDEDYTIIPMGEPRVLKSSVLTLEKDGQIIQRLKATEEGKFFFTFLPYYDDGTFGYIENPDLSSLFGVSIEGQFIPEEDKEEEGQLIYLLNEEGAASKVTYTEEEGKFTFSEVPPQANYSIGVEEKNIGGTIKIDDRIEKIRSTAIVNYRRLEPEEVARVKMVDGSVVEIKEGENLRLKQLQYEFESSYLTADAKKILDELYELYSLNPGLKIELLSHTDSRGTDEYNQELSDKRAKRAVEYLKNKGISPESVFGTGLGETKLLNDCDDSTECPEEKHAENRRTEVILHIE